MKRSFLASRLSSVGTVAASTTLIAATYGLVRLAYGLFLPDVVDALSIDSAMAGLIASSASVLYCVAALIAFVTAARFPRVIVVAAGCAGGLGAAGMASAGSAWMFGASAVLGSAGAGFASPALVTLVSRNVMGRRIARSQTIVNSGTGPGLMAAGALALAMTPDWRPAWGIAAAVTVAAAGAVILLDVGPGGGSDDRAHGLPSVRLPPPEWFRAHRGIIVAAGLLGAGSAAVWNLGRALLVAAGADGSTSIVAWIVIGAGGTAAIATARPMAVMGPRRAWTVTTLAVAVACGTLAAFPDLPGAALPACAVFGWGYTAATGALITWTTSLDPARAPAGTSLLFVVLVLGQAAGAAAIGALVVIGGYLAAFLVATGLTVGAALAARVRIADGRAARDLSAFGGTNGVHATYDLSTAQRGAASGEEARRHLKDPPE